MGGIMGENAKVGKWRQRNHAMKEAEIQNQRKRLSHKSLTDANLSTCKLKARLPPNAQVISVDD